MTAAGAAAGARPRDEIAIVLGLALLAAAVALGGWAWRLDRVVYDLGLSLWRRDVPPDITLVAIDDASLQAIGRWPWRRAVHATLLQQLAAMQPRAVALDLVLSEPDPDPAQDRLLAQALAAAPVVLPLSWQSIGGLPPTVLAPAPLLAGAARLGVAEPVVDADGVLRHAFLRAGPPGAHLPHLALALLQAGGEALPPGLPVDDAAVAPGAWGREGRFLIRYAGPPGWIDRVSYVDVLRGAVPAERLRGRYVLVGMTAQGLGDTLATPVNARHRAMPGVEVLAHTLHTLRSGDRLRAVPDAAVAALSAAAVALLVLGFGRVGARRALPLAIASVPLAAGASLAALGAGLWCSPVPYALAAALAYPLWSWRRLERAVAGLDREIARLEDDAPHPVPAAAARPDALEDRLQTLRRAGELLRDARAFLAETVAALPTAMLVGDARGRVALANPVAAALFEVGDADELRGLDLLRLLGEFETAVPVDWAEATAALPAAGVAVEARLGQHGDFVVHVAAVAVQGLRRLIVTIADIAPVKRAQREREELLAFVSHDLRSPASSIVLLADMNLQPGAAATPHDELLRQVRRLAARTLEMSEDFVRAAQVQTRPLDLQPASAHALVAEATADLQAQAQAAAVALPLRPDGADPAVQVDRPLLVRAIGNLLGNAIKHSPPGSAVHVQCDADADTWRLTVRDRGPGLSAAQLAQLARGGEGAAVRDARGVGLGLLFVQRVLARHGGRLRAAVPADGPGAEFRLELPRRPPPPPPPHSGNP